VAWLGPKPAHPKRNNLLRQLEDMERQAIFGNTLASAAATAMKLRGSSAFPAAP